MKESGCEVPDWMLALKAPSKNQKKNLAKRPIDRKTIKTTSSYDEKRQNKKREMVQGSQNRKKSKPVDINPNPK